MIWQRLIETYDANVGVAQEGELAVTPVGYKSTRCAYEITIDVDGNFIKAAGAGKDEPGWVIDIPNNGKPRSGNSVPQPLFDNLKYLCDMSFLSEKEGVKHKDYMAQLKKWAYSDHGHPALRAMYAYLSKDAVLQDLLDSGVIPTDGIGKDHLMEYRGRRLPFRNNGKKTEIPAAAGVLRFRVKGLAPEEPWLDGKLRESYAAFASESAAGEVSVCMATGKMCACPPTHPKQLVSVGPNASLISSNDRTNYTWRGRFRNAADAVTVGAEASFKISNVIRWLDKSGRKVSNGDRAYYVWCTDGTGLPLFAGWGGADFLIAGESRPEDELRTNEIALPETGAYAGKDAAVLGLDVPVAGRISVVSYEELDGAEYVRRLRRWVRSCGTRMGRGLKAPTPMKLLAYAFGRERNGVMKLDDRDRGYISHELDALIGCILYDRPIGPTLVSALAERASAPRRYKSEALWRSALRVACAALRRQDYDFNRGGTIMAYDPEIKDRDLQYGYLLSICERIETEATNDLERPTTALRLMSVYRATPGIVMPDLIMRMQVSYMQKLSYSSRSFFQRMIDRCVAIIAETESEGGTEGMPLGNRFLLGYSMQRQRFYKFYRNADGAAELAGTASYAAKEVER